MLRALSRHGGRASSRSLGDFPGESGARSAGQPFKDGARSSVMQMACGAACPRPGRPTPAGRTFRGSTSRPQTFSSPTAARGCSSKTLLSPRHWDLVSSLESLVNLRSGSRHHRAPRSPKSLLSPYIWKGLCFTVHFRGNKHSNAKVKPFQKS